MTLNGLISLIIKDLLYILQVILFVLPGPPTQPALCPGRLNLMDCVNQAPLTSVFQLGSANGRHGRKLGNRRGEGPGYLFLWFPPFWITWFAVIVFFSPKSWFLMVVPSRKLLILLDSGSLSHPHVSQGGSGFPVILAPCAPTSLVAFL